MLFTPAACTTLSLISPQAILRHLLIKIWLWVIIIKSTKYEKLAWYCNIPICHYNTLPIWLWVHPGPQTGLPAKLKVVWLVLLYKIKVRQATIRDEQTYSECRLTGVPPTHPPTILLYSPWFTDGWSIGLIEYMDWGLCQSCSVAC